MTGATSAINAPAAWCLSTGRGIVIADIDTGADFNHPDLQGKLIPGEAFQNGNGQASGQGQDAVQDNNGHGTDTTGLMMADTNNNQGIASVAPDAKALIIKVLKFDGSGSSSDVAAGIDYAISRKDDLGVRVINLSLGTDTNPNSVTGQVAIQLDQQMEQAIHRAAQAGLAVSLAAGNKAANYNPALLSTVAQDALIVGAVGPDGELASYSNSGSAVAIYAPGGNSSNGNYKDPYQKMIVSTIWYQGESTYGAGEGTSDAAPLVAGALADLMATGLNAAQARAAITSHAVTRNGLPELDLAGSLGARNTCGPSPPRAASNPQVGPSKPIAAASAGPKASPTPVALTVVTPAPTPPNAEPAYVPAIPRGVPAPVIGVGALAGVLALAIAVWKLVL